MNSEERKMKVLLYSDLSYINLNSKERSDKVIIVKGLLNLSTKLNQETGEEEYLNTRWYDKDSNGNVIRDSNGEPIINDQNKKQLENVERINQHKSDLLEEAEIIATRYDEKTGMEAIAIKKGDEITISYRGTESTSMKDIFTDVVDIGMGRYQGQFEVAVDFANEIYEKHGNDIEKVNMVGHSLGGSLAKVAALLFKNKEKLGTVDTLGAPSMINLDSNPGYSSIRENNSAGRRAYEEYKKDEEYYDGIIINHVHAYDHIPLYGSVGIGTTKYYANSLNFVETMVIGIRELKSHSLEGYYNIIGSKDYDIRGMIPFFSAPLSLMNIEREGLLIPNYLTGNREFVRQEFLRAEALRVITRRRDPLALDLDGDGIEVVDLENGVNFDLDRNTIAEKTSWIGRDDGLLVIDKNQDGIINDGGELFGDQTTLKDGELASNAFEALEEYDSNKDNKIDKNDELFNSLQVWQDKDQDGYSDKDELKSLQELGIESLSLENQRIDRSIEGGILTRVGNYTKTDGKIYELNEYLFNRDLFDSVSNELKGELVEVMNYFSKRPEVLFLPDYKGQGNLESLRVAMVKNEELLKLVTDFVEIRGEKRKKEKLDEILISWTDGGDTDSKSRGDNIDARKLKILEVFNGEKFTGINGSNPNEQAGVALNVAYQSLYEDIYYTLRLQSDLAFVLVLADFEGEEADFSKVGEYILREREENLYSGTALYKGLVESEMVFSWKDKSNFQNVVDHLIEEEVRWKDPEAIFIGGREEDDLRGDSTSNLILGGKGKDEIRAYLGDDVLEGGKGEDFLQGGRDNDTYIYNRGDGEDVIFDSWYEKGHYRQSDNNSGYDTLKFGNDIEKEELAIKLIGEDLIIGIIEQGKTFSEYSDKITIRRWKNRNNRLEKFVLSGGLELDVAGIVELIGSLEDDVFTFTDSSVRVSLKEGNDNVISGGYSDKIHLGSGDDRVNSGSGDDVLFGEEGNDELRAYLGDDTLVGGEGKDFLQGGRDNDIYIFSRGDGEDLIFDSWYEKGHYRQSDNNSGNDTLKFGEKIIPSDISMKLVGEDLVIGIREVNKTFSEYSDKITIRRWKNRNNRLERFIFSDGNEYGIREIVSLLGSNEDDSVSFIEEDLDVDLGKGNDKVWSGGHRDKVKLGSGDDEARTYLGDDILEGGEGKDFLQGGQDNDTYIYNRGDGEDLIFDSWYEKDHYRESNYYSGYDTLKFGIGITLEDLEGKLVGDDLIVGVKEDSKSFSDYSDQIIIRRWKNRNNRIEKFVFSDGLELDIAGIVELIGSSEDETFTFTDSNVRVSLKEGNDNVTSGGYSDEIHLGSGDDRANSGSGDDVLFGEEGNDELRAYLGNDTLVGGEGKDFLQGGRDDDTYIYNRGDGEDLIFDSWYEKDHYRESDNNSGYDTLKFGEEIVPSDISMKLVGEDLVVGLREVNKTFSDYSDKITIRRWKNRNNRIEKFVFSDGIKYEVKDIISLLGSNEDDFVSFTELALDLDLGEGSDKVWSGSQGDEVKLGSGDDEARTYLGDDILEGGRGKDLLQGGRDNDTYIYNRGDGEDLIFDSWYEKNHYRQSDNNSGYDTLKFGSGISVEELEGKLVGDDLIIGIKEDGKSFSEYMDKVTVRRWKNKNNRLEKFILSGGLELDIVGIVELIGSSEDDTFTFTDSSVRASLKEGNDNVTSGGYSDEIHLGSGDDRANSGSGDDVLFGEEGNDELRAYLGNDTLVGGEGEDFLQGGRDNDIYIYNRGDGEDLIFDSWYERGHYRQSDNNSGYDTLKFGNGIEKEELAIKLVGEDLIIGIIEQGKTFSDYSDKITIRRWKNRNNRLERFIFSDGSEYGVREIVSLLGSNEDDSISFTELALDLDLGKGNDKVWSGSHGDKVKLGIGDDEARTYLGDDILEGGRGKDFLQGGKGNDTYIYNRGDGLDLIFDSWYEKDHYRQSDNNSGYDTLKFGSRISMEELEGKLVGDDLIIGIKEDGKSFGEYNDQITIRRWKNRNNRLEKFVLSDGLEVGVEGIVGIIGSSEDDNFTFTDSSVRVSLRGGNDNITTGNYDDIVNLGEDDDKINSGSGDDSLDGGGGNDELRGSLGSDILVGGKGEDLLQGGQDNDTYIYNKGDGADLIFDSWYEKDHYRQSDNNSGYDILKFGSGISIEELEGKLVGDDLIIGIKEDGKSFGEYNDQITIRRWKNRNNRLEKFVFLDGIEYEVKDIISFLGSNEGDYVSFTEVALDLDLGKGNDKVWSGSHSDIVKLGSGDDEARTYLGSDILEGGEGKDFLQGGRDNDTYIYNRGDGSDLIFDSWYEKDHYRQSDNNSGDDKLKLEDGIKLEDVLLKKLGSDLVIGIDDKGIDFDELDDTITIRRGLNRNNSVETLSIENIDYNLSKIVQRMAEIPDEGIIEFKNLSEDLKVNNLSSSLSQYLKKVEEE